MKDTRLSDFLKGLEDVPGFTGLSEIAIDTVSGFGETPLHVAAVRGDVAIIELLIEAGADVNRAGEHMYTPLHEAAAQGHHTVVNVLLKSGALPDLKTDEGWTYLELLETLHEKRAEEGGA